MYSYRIPETVSLHNVKVYRSRVSSFFFESNEMSFTNLQSPENPQVSCGITFVATKQLNRDIDPTISKQRLKNVDKGAHISTMVRKYQMISSGTQGNSLVVCILKDYFMQNLII